MTEYIKVKINDRGQLKQVLPLPADGQEDVPEVAKFILSIIGQTIQVKKLRSSTGSFHYISDIDHRFVIMPNWIEYFDTVELVPVKGGLGLLILEDGTVMI